MRGSLAEHLIPRQLWNPFPKAADREAWDAARARHADGADALIGTAERRAGEPLPPLTATGFLEYTRTGDRQVYGRACHERQHRLSALALAECFEGRGRFLDPLADVIWAICEQTTWCLPAHERVRGGHERRPLPDPVQPTVALCSAGTAFALAEVHHLLAPELDTVSPRIPERIRFETALRVIEPYMEWDWWWMGPASDQGEVNNWNAVCNAGACAAALYLYPDPERLVPVIERALESLEHFLDCYGPDGGCDEGMSYWNYGVGHLAMLAELLHSRTGGRLNLFADPRVRAMAEFPHRVHLTGEWFANFSDSGARGNFDPGVCFRFAERVGSAGLRALASQQLLSNGRPDRLPVRLRDLFWVPEHVEPLPLPDPAHVAFPNLQWLVARPSDGESDGLVLAAKAGHNAEKHNHNDVGAFILCGGGRPLIVDLGAPVYTAKTFGPERYELLETRSLGHNVPLVNGREQMPGRGRAAEHVEMAEDEGGRRSRLTMDLAGLYPPEAGLRRWVRSFVFDRDAREVRLTDAWWLEGASGELAIPLYVPEEAEVDLDGSGRARIRAGETVLTLTLDSPHWRPETETVPLGGTHTRQWGEAVTRLWLRASEAPAQGTLTLRARLAP
jgi:hypothetical protein